MPHRLVCQVVDDGEHQAVNNRNRQLGAGRRDAEENTRCQENEQQGREGGHKNTEHIYKHVKENSLRGWGWGWGLGSRGRCLLDIPTSQCIGLKIE